MKKLMVALAAAVLLAGCIKIDRSPPKDLPDYVRPYPGATTVMSLNMGQMSSVAQQTTAAPGDVISFYRNEAQADGLQEAAKSIEAAGAVVGQRQVTFANTTGDKLLIVSVQAQGSGAAISLTYKSQPKATS